MVSHTIPGHGKLRQEGLEFPASLGYIAKSIPKSKTRNYELPMSCGFLESLALCK